MFPKFILFLAALGLLSLTGAYNITSHVVDGVPEYLNITTEPFVQIGNGYYYIENQLEKNWYDAFESCRQIGAELISFETIEEWDAIHLYLFELNIYDLYWTSGNDLAKTGKHVWHSTGENVTLNIWAPGEPNNHSGLEHCDEIGYLGSSTNYNVFNDIPCGLERYYICEKQPKTASFIVW